MITEIGLAFVAISPIVGLFVGGKGAADIHDRALTRAYCEGYDNGFTVGLNIASRSQEITRRLYKENDELQDALDVAQERLSEIRRTNCTAAEYIAALNWGSRDNMSRVYDVPDASAIYEFANMGGA